MLKNIKENIIPIIIITAAVLLRYHELFTGANLFIYKDQFINSGFSYGNSIGNGWRPDKGFGLSFFFADPGLWHAWSVFTFWEKLFSSRVMAYHSSVLLLDILAAIAVYFFLRRIVPQLGKKACLLAPLIVFSMSQDGNHFNRALISSAIGVPFWLMLLYNYYKQPKLMYLFLAGLLFWFVVFFGVLWNFSILLSMGFVFTAIYGLYYKNLDRIIFLKYAVIITVGGLIMVLLGFWVFYSVLIEKGLVQYLREKNFVFQGGFVPDIKAIGGYISSLFQFYSVPANINFFGLGWRPFYYSYNVAFIFPIVFIFYLFRRAATFWEFSLTWLLLVFYIFHAVILIPVIRSLYSLICIKSSLLVSFYYYDIFVFPLQIGLIGIFVVLINEDKLRLSSPIGAKIVSMAAVLFFLAYSAFLIFSIFALFLPGVLPMFLTFLLQHFAPEKLGRFSKDYLIYGALGNLKSLQASMHWYSLAFYLLSAIFAFLFIRTGKILSFIKNKTTLFLSLLLILGILFSWTVYPLNRRQPVWQEIAPSLPKFMPMDRFYYVGAKRLENEPLNPDTLAHIKKRVEGAGGLLRYLNARSDYFECPGLSLHGVRCFTQKDVGEFILHIFNGDGIIRLENMRDLLGGPLVSSELLDMSAVNYYYSTEELEPVPDNLALYAKTNLITIYKNLNAWPYFYLADKIEIKEPGKHLKGVRRGTAYVAKNEFFTLPQDKDDSNIELKEFSYGKMVFDYSGNKENLLVIADAWHPFWKAKAGNQYIAVVKVNEIFKGVRLPKGNYSFTLFFDNSPYSPGIYVSIVAWVLFCAGLLFVRKYDLEVPFLINSRQ